MKPYYEEKGITIFHGDCREILSEIPHVDLVLTDPPYPDFNSDHGKDWNYVDIGFVLLGFECKQFVFWPATRPFPLSYTAMHVWHKPNGQSNEHYEFVFERFGLKVYRVFRVPIINYESLPEWTEHPSQKPTRLIKQLIQLSDLNLILDPFMGSGTTLRAAKDLGRQAIGIEIEEKYCEIAANRLRQEVFQFESEPFTKNDYQFARDLFFSEPT